MLNNSISGVGDIDAYVFLAMNGVRVLRVLPEWGLNTYVKQFSAVSIFSSLAGHPTAGATSHDDTTLMSMTGMTNRTNTRASVAPTAAKKRRSSFMPSSIVESTQTAHQTHVDKIRDILEDAFNMFVRKRVGDARLMLETMPKDASNANLNLAVANIVTAIVDDWPLADARWAHVAATLGAGEGVMGKFQIIIFS
jgi:capsule polysaccharide modification protein KpsS